MKILIVGYGSIGKRHELICKTIDPSCEIIVVTRNHLCSARYAYYVTRSLRDGIAQKPDFAIIASPANLHVQHAITLIRAGCDCLVEKPLADNLQEPLELLTLNKTHKRIVQVGYNLRYNSCLIKIRKMIDDGVYGNLLSVRCEFGQYLPDWRPGFDYRQSVSAQKSLGGGILLEMSHEIDYLSWIVGETEWVSAWIGTIGSLDIDVEDTAHLRLGMIHKRTEVVASINLDFIRRDRVRRCDFICEGGTIRWDGVRNIVTYESKDSLLLYSGSQDRNQTYVDQFRDFLDCISKEQECISDLQSGLRTLKIIEASRLSSVRSGVKCFVK